MKWICVVDRMTLLKRDVIAIEAALDIRNENVGWVLLYQLAHNVRTLLIERDCRLHSGCSPACGRGTQLAPRQRNSGWLRKQNIAIRRGRRPSRARSNSPLRPPSRRPVGESAQPAYTRRAGSYLIAPARPSRRALISAERSGRY